MNKSPFPEAWRVWHFCRCRKPVTPHPSSFAGQRALQQPFKVTLKAQSAGMHVATYQVFGDFKKRIGKNEKTRFGFSGSAFVARSRYVWFAIEFRQS
jgi:hypothetical protein